MNSGFIALGGLKPLDESYTNRPTLSIFYASCDVCKVLNGGIWTSSLGSSFPIRSGMGDDDQPFLLLSSISLLLIYNKMAKKLEKKNDSIPGLNPRTAGMQASSLKPEAQGLKPP